MPEKFDLRGGQTGMLILRLLTEGDRYGSELSEELRVKSDGLFHLRGGTLYPVLRTLEKKEWISTYEAVHGAGRTRRYYHLTDTGREALRRQILEWRDYVATVNQVIR